MVESQQQQQKADKRAAALRDNLKKRKAFIKDTKQTTQESKNAKS